MKHELWIYEGGRATQVETARHRSTLKLFWIRRGYRDAAIALDGELLEHRPGTEPMALEAITAAAREAAQVAYEADEAFCHPPAVIASVPELESPEPPRDDSDDRDNPFDDDASWDGCPVPDYTRSPTDLEGELKTFASELALGPELVGPGPLQEASPSLHEAPPLTTPTTTPCAARGCAGTVRPGPAPAELADLCPGHRSQARKAVARLGCDQADAARAIRVYGAANRSTVNLSRVAA